MDVVLLFIEDNLHKKITLKELSERFEINYCHLSTVFKSRTGMSFSKYIRSKKIGLAKISLEKKDKEIKEISYDLGYKSQTQFYRDFKFIVGMPPKRYRKVYMGLVSKNLLNKNQNIDNKPNK